MLRRLCFLTLGLAAVTVAAALNAGEPRQTKDKQPLSAQQLRELSQRQKVLQERYRKFEEALQGLHDRLAGGSAADKERAAKLKAALDRSVEGTVTERFAKFAKALGGNVKDGQFGDLIKQSQELARDLQEVLDLLEGGGKKLVNHREEKLSLEAKIKELDRLIRKEQVVKGQVEIGLDPKQIQENQREVTQATKEFAKKLANEKKGDKGDKNDKNGQGNEAKNDKSQAKEAKGDGDKGQSKDAGKENKSGESKPGDAKNQGDKKDSKPGQSKQGGKDSKPGKESKPGDSKSSKGSESKSGQSKDGKGSESKSGQSKESKNGNGKEGEAKDGGKKKEGDEQKSSLKTKQDEKKAGDGDKNKKEGSAKEGQQGGDKKQGSAKQGQQGGDKKSQQSQSKSGDSKASKSSQGQAKSGKSSQGQGQPKPGGESQDDQGSSKKDSPKADNQQPQKKDPQRHVDDAIVKQKDAEKKLGKNDKKPAKDDIDKAVDNLKLAKQKLEELLRQLREEEQKQLLETLIARCKQMKKMQEDVQKETKASALSIDSHNDKKPDRTDTLDLLKQSDDEMKIVVEATKAIELLEAEGSAVAFPEVFQQVREDMKSVARKLKSMDPRKEAKLIEKDMRITIAIEQDIIDTLDEMIKALQKELKQKEQKPSPPSNGQPPPQADPKLLNKIQELKMVRAMQVRVNARTELYGKTYEGEQADTSPIRRDLRELSNRQERIFEITNRIAKGD